MYLTYLRICCVTYYLPDRYAPDARSVRQMRLEKYEQGQIGLCLRARLYILGLGILCRSGSRRQKPTK